MSNERTGVLELTLGDDYIGSAYSPQVEVTDTETGHEVAITYMSPEGITTERFDVADGETGPQGPAGFSPTVTITDTPTGHTVTITDEDGPHSYDVPNYAQEEQQRQDAWDTLSGEVTDAITAAESATSAASTAATSATSAATSANTAAQAATTAAASANTAASSANAAANAANSAATAAGTAADAATTAAGDATDAASAANTAAQAAQEAATEVAPEVAWLWGNQLTGELTGDILTAADAYAAPPMALTVDGRSTQNGTPTPDAPVPIESVDELTIHANGSHGAMWWNQMLDPIVKTEVIAVGVTLKVESDGKFSYTGTTTSTGGRLNFVAINIGIVSGHKYLLLDTATYDDSSSNWYLSIIPAAAVYAELTPNTIFTASGDATCGLGKNLARADKTYNLSGYVSLYDLTAMFGAGNEPSTVAEFKAMFPEPYYPYDAGSWIDSDNWPVSISMQGYVLRSLPDGTKDTLALTYLRPSTREGWAVYGASLTQRVMETTIDGNHPIVQVQNANRLRVNLNVPTYMNSAAMADQLTWGNVIAPNSMTIGANTTIYALLSYSDFPTLADYKAHLAEHPMTLLYALATPVTTDLGEVELPVLSAPNCTVWADPTTGLQMEYVRDTNLVVSSLSAETAIAYASIATVDGPTATESHAVGTYLTMQGKLYKVTTAIAVGETIAAGTNVTQTTVMAELIARTA